MIKYILLDLSIWYEEGNLKPNKWAGYVNKGFVYISINLTVCLHCISLNFSLHVHVNSCFFTWFSRYKLPFVGFSCRNNSLRFTPIRRGGFGTSKMVGIALSFNLFSKHSQTFLLQNVHCKGGYLYEAFLRRTWRNLLVGNWQPIF